MADQHYENPRLAAVYDLNSGWSEDRQFYLELAGTKPLEVLELGAGTGLVSRAIAARGHRVTAVDPAPAMLAVGRDAEHGETIEWIKAGAEDFCSDKRFDLIFMTGNAFQVFLDEASMHAALRTMAAHLAPGGFIAFESRNPAVDWAARWAYSHELEDADGTLVQVRNLKALENAIARFELVYRFPDETIVTESKIRFWTREEVGAGAANAGLKVEKVLGDCAGEDFDADRHSSMVFLLRKA